MKQLGRQRIARIISLAALLSCGIASTRAETVQTIDHGTINGVPTACDGTTVTISANGKQSTVPMDDILTISLRVIVPPTPAPTAAPADAPQPATTARRRIRRAAAATAPAEASAATPAATSAPAPAATTLPAGAMESRNWRLQLTDGTTLHGTLETWTSDLIQIKPDGAPSDLLSIDPHLLQAIWHGDAGLQSKAEGMQRPADQDTAFVYKNSDQPVVAVSGSVDGVDGNDILFRYNESQRKLAIIKLDGVIFAPHATTQPAAQAATQPAGHQLFHLIDDEKIAARWTSLQNGKLSLMTVGGKPSTLQLSSVATIQFFNGRVVYLSDLKPTRVEQTPYFDRVIPYRTDAALEGGPLMLSDGPHEKGLAMHSRCVLEYTLDAPFDRFHTEVGFDPNGGKVGDANLRVLGDGKVIYEATDAKGSSPPVPVDADVKGVSKLTIEVDFGSGQDVGDRVVWADALLVSRKDQTQ